MPDSPPPPQRRGTAGAILDAAIAEIQRSGVDGARIEVILDGAYASKSSLYHHFGGRDELIAEAERELYRKLGNAESRALIDEAAATATPEEFQAFIGRQICRAVTDPSQAPVRQARIRAMAAGVDSAEQRAELAGMQRTMLTIMSQIIIDAQARGVANRDLDPFAYTAFAHGVVLSEMLVAAAVDDPADWLAVAIPALLAPLAITDTD